MRADHIPLQIGKNLINLQNNVKMYNFIDFVTKSMLQLLIILTRETLEGYAEFDLAHKAIHTQYGIARKK